jgi:hypothetical protein
LPVSDEEARARLERYFEVEILRCDIRERAGMYREQLDGTGRQCFIFITRRGAARLVLREGVDPARIIAGSGSGRWKRLEISVLHSLVLEECLGLDTAELAERGDLFFTPWENRALAAVEEGEAEAAFLVRAVRMREIWETAERGERMPHKSTYFYPKIPSGMLIYDHETALS